VAGQQLDKKLRARMNWGCVANDLPNKAGS